MAKLKRAIDINRDRRKLTEKELASKKFYCVDFECGSGPWSKEKIIITEKQKDELLNRINACDPEITIDDDDHEYYEMEVEDVQGWLENADPITWDEIKVLRKFVGILDCTHLSDIIQCFEAENGLEKKVTGPCYAGQYSFELVE